MCSLLKNQACDLEKTLNFCDTIKDDLGFKYTQNNSSIEVCMLVCDTKVCKFQVISYLRVNFMQKVEEFC